MKIYIVNGKGRVVATIRVADPSSAAAIGTQRVVELRDDRAYWTDEKPKARR